MANDFKKLSDRVKPREQLRDAVSPTELKAEDLLAILLKTGAAGCNVMETACRMMDAFGSVAELVRSDWRTLAARITEYNAAHVERPIKGVGQVKLLELAAAFELVRRGYEPDVDDIRKKTISRPENAYEIFRRACLLGDEQENFFVLPVDSKNHPLCTEPLRVTRGIQDRAPVHAREVFKHAIRWGASAIFIAHNHPSGDPMPSQMDVELTKELILASKVVSIPILDHLVIGAYDSNHGRGFISLRQIKQDIFKTN